MNFVIKRTFEKIEQAQVILLLVDGSKLLADDQKLKNIVIDYEKIKNQNPQNKRFFENAPV